MSLIPEDRDRSVVPRWRPFRSSLATGELSTYREPAAIETSEFDQAVSDFLAEPSLGRAADALSVAISLGVANVPNEIAALVESSANPFASLARRSAQRLTGRGLVAPPDYSDDQFVDRRARIHRLRRSANFDPRNPFPWTDLALEYTILGLRRQALEMAAHALSLAASNRFVLRAYSRLLVHHGDPDRAHDLLNRYGDVRGDPWLAAAELSLAKATGRHSRVVRSSFALLDQDLPTLHKSELAAALGTLEHASGNRRSARRLFALALDTPTENAVAQVAWAQRRDNQLGMRIRERLSQSPEAAAWSALQNGDWPGSLAAAERWLSDQPFSSRPALLLGYVSASVLDDPASAERHLRAVQRANPGEFTLQNDLAFSLALQDKIPEALSEFRKINSSGLTPDQAIVYAATTGLILFRSGDADRGRESYLQAISSAKRSESRLRLEAVASVRLAFEEVHAKTSEQFAAMARAREKAKMISDRDPDVAEMMRRLEQAAANSQAVTTS